MFRAPFRSRRVSGSRRESAADAYEHFGVGGGSDAGGGSRRGFTMTLSFGGSGDGGSGGGGGGNEIRRALNSAPMQAYRARAGTQSLRVRALWYLCARY